MFYTLVMSGTLARFRQYLDNLMSSFWAIPGSIVVILTATAFGLVFVDGAYVDFLKANLPWLFGGQESAGRDVLSTIAAAAVSIVAVSFSITIVALQLASSQFSPRVLRNFLQHPGVQIVLGMYIGTFAYSLVVLRSVRGSAESQDQFVPSLSITFAILLALVCVFCLVYFIHYISQALQISHLLVNIRSELDAEIERYLEEPAAEHKFLDESEDTHHLSRGRRVYSAKDGYLRSVDYDSILRKFATCGVDAGRICVVTGQYVNQCTPILVAKSEDKLPDDFDNVIRECFFIQSQRTVFQDPLFGVRQLVDIALKALSPSMNDPTTAEQCIHQLGAAIAKIINKPFPTSLYCMEKPHLYVQRISFDDLLEEAFGQILHAAKEQPHVLRTLLEEFQKLYAFAVEPERGKSIEKISLPLKSLLPHESRKKTTEVRNLFEAQA